ncbi:MAG TPA: hypothetical protein VG797_11640 [Phycisphaerales bacterium]|nr:hypothetical protein [Phycisphaerales bacterium]
MTIRTMLRHVFVPALAIAAVLGTAPAHGKGPVGENIKVRATAIRITADLSNSTAIEQLIRDEDRLAKVLPAGGMDKFMTNLKQLGDVEVLGAPEATVESSGEGRLRFQSKSLTEHKERGFISGMSTRFGLWFQPTVAEDGKMRLSLSGSMLAYTPDQNGAAVGQASTYTRLRDFETDVKVANGQPVVLGGPMLKEEGDGGWTALILVVTPERAGQSYAEAAGE